MKKVLLVTALAVLFSHCSVYAQNDLIITPTEEIMTQTESGGLIIEAVEDSIPTPTVMPTALPEATPIPTAAPTALPEATPTPTAMPTALPAATSTPTATPTALPEATSIPTAAPTALPEATSTPTATPTPTSYGADFIVEGEGWNIAQDIGFALYDGEKLVAECTHALKEDEREFSIEFTTPEYEIGKAFHIVCTHGAGAVRYYEKLYKVGERVDAPTYQYLDDDGNRIVVTRTAMNIITRKHDPINISVDKNPLRLRSAPIEKNGNIMVPVREMSEALGVFDVYYDGVYNSVRVAVAENEVLFNLDYYFSTVNGENINENVLPMYMGKNIYVPLATLAKGLDSEMTFEKADGKITISLTRSKHVTTKKLEYITSQKLTSKTDYLIWISKKNYEVNVFKNSGGVWNLEKTFPCAIGTDETPTCTGTYRYYEKIDRWTYPDFYVAPVMRFNGGYAIHSTLIKYDGTDHNRTVRKKLSHGCVRVQPPEMQWLFDNVPLQTTVHVTNT